MKPGVAHLGVDPGQHCVVVRSSNCCSIASDPEQEVKLKKDIIMKPDQQQQVMTCKPDHCHVKSGQVHNVKSGQVYNDKPHDDNARKANEMLGDIINHKTCHQNIESHEDDENMKKNVEKHKQSGKPGEDGLKKKGGGGERRRVKERAAVPAWLGVLAAALVSSTLLQGCLAIDERTNSISPSDRSSHQTSLDMPHFLEPISNVTVPAGRDVRLACVVDHLGSYKLAWIQKDRSAILTVGNHVITRNIRIGVSHDGHRTWYLTIKNVRPGDAGTYMCQINTEIAISQTGHVSVVVPPYIKDEMSSGDVNLQERMDLTLACSARGSPVPTIKWRREDNQRIRANHSMSLLEVHGPLLHLTDVTRTDMGAYLCIARNGIPPAVSKRIEVSVKFLPTVIVPHQLVGVPYGQNVTLECYIEAWPQGLNYWKRPNGIDVLNSDDKYIVKEMPGSQKYKTQMMLTITHISKADIGEYNCIANNSQGGAEQVIRVSLSSPPPHNRNAIDKSYESKDNSYGKAPLSSVNWSKETDGSSALKDEHEDVRKSPPKKYQNPQHDTNTKILNQGLDIDLSLLPPSASCASSPFLHMSWCTSSCWGAVGVLVNVFNSPCLLILLLSAGL